MVSVLIPDILFSGGDNSHIVIRIYSLDGALSLGSVPRKFYDDKIARSCILLHWL